jgi:hypothetical protein
MQTNPVDLAGVPTGSSLIAATTTTSTTANSGVAASSRPDHPVGVMAAASVFAECGSCTRPKARLLVLRTGCRAGAIARRSRRSSSSLRAFAATAAARRDLRLDPDLLAVPWAHPATDDEQERRSRPLLRRRERSPATRSRSRAQRGWTKRSSGGRQPWTPGPEARAFPAAAGRPRDRLRRGCCVHAPSQCGIKHPQRGWPLGHSLCQTPPY